MQCEGRESEVVDDAGPQVRRERVGQFLVGAGFEQGDGRIGIFLHLDRMGDGILVFDPAGILEAYLVGPRREDRKRPAGG